MIINHYDHTVSLGGSCGKQNGFLEAAASALVSPSHPPASNSLFSEEGQWSRRAPGPSGSDISSSSDLSVLCGTEAMWTEVSPLPSAGESQEGLGSSTRMITLTSRDGHAGAWTPAGAAKWGHLHLFPPPGCRGAWSTVCLFLSPASHPEHRPSLLQQAQERQIWLTSLQCHVATLDSPRSKAKVKQSAAFQLAALQRCQTGESCISGVVTLLPASSASRAAGQG